MGSDGYARTASLRCDVVEERRSAAGDFVPLGAWLGLPEGHGEPQELVAGVVAGAVLLTVFPDERWCARSMRHYGRAVGRSAYCQIVVLLSFLLTMSWTVNPFRMNNLSCQAKPSQANPSQAKVLTVPLSVSHSCV